MDGLLDIKIGKENYEVLDIPSMHGMPDESYANYVDSGLLWVDHHEILRATVGGYPIATSSQQVEILIEYLRRAQRQMQAAGK